MTDGGAPMSGQVARFRVTAGPHANNDLDANASTPAEGFFGNDVIHGNLGNDVIRGGPGAEALVGSDGDDAIVGDAGQDQMWGQDGIDRFFVRDGEIDRVSGGDGGDVASRDAFDIVSGVP